MFCTVGFDATLLSNNLNRIPFHTLPLIVRLRISLQNNVEELLISLLGNDQISQFVSNYVKETKKTSHVRF